MRKSSLQFWWCLLVCFSFINMLNTSITKCHCQKTRLCTTGSYRYDKNCSCEKYSSRKVSSIWLEVLQELHFRHTNRIAALYPNIKNSRTSYFEYHFPVLFVLLYFAAVVMVYHVVSVYQKNLCNSTQLQSALERQAKF